MKMLKLSQQTKILLLSFLFLITMYLIFGLKSDKPLINSSSDAESIDTLIPNGLVLTPVNLANADSISALIEHYAVVDLFTTATETKGAKKIASKVKLVRSAVNSNQFAVLVQPKTSEAIMQSSTQFVAAIQNRNSKQDLTIEKENHNVRIEYHQTGVDL